MWAGRSSGAGAGRPAPLPRAAGVPRAPRVVDESVPSLPSRPPASVPAPRAPPLQPLCLEPAPMPGGLVSRARKLMPSAETPEYDLGPSPTVGHARPCATGGCRRKGAWCLPSLQCRALSRASVSVPPNERPLPLPVPGLQGQPLPALSSRHTARSPRTRLGVLRRRTLAMAGRFGCACWERRCAPAPEHGQRPGQSSRGARGALGTVLRSLVTSFRGRPRSWVSSPSRVRLSGCLAF